MVLNDGDLSIPRRFQAVELCLLVLGVRFRPKDMLLELVCIILVSGPLPNSP